MPFTKYSYFVGQPSQVRVPVRVRIEIFTSSGGAVFVRVDEEVASRIVLTIFAQMGEAPVIPEAMLDMGELLLFPTQVETRKSLV